MPRVYLSPEILEPGIRGEEFSLDLETAKKLTRVLRLTPGEMFIAFDGLGGEWDCALVASGASSREDSEDASSERSAQERAVGRISAKNVRAVVIGERATKPQGRLHLSVAQAIPKGDKMDWVLQKGTELGVAEFWPFQAARSVPVLDEGERATGRTERWRKIAQASAAQCGRSDVPIVHAIGELATVVDAGTRDGGRCFMLDELGEVDALRMALRREPLQWDDDREIQTRVMLLVGPEGGWTPREREWAERYGVESVGLGRLVLRTETAALVAAAVLQWEAGELG